jgi:hypothetical protein
LDLLFGSCFFDSLPTIFQAHLHICKEFLELSSGFLGGFELFVLALALWIATRCDFDRIGIWSHPWIQFFGVEATCQYGRFILLDVLFTWVRVFH